MTAWHTRIYTDPATGEIVARYVSLDGELWLSAMSADDVADREQARRSIRQASDQNSVNDTRPS